MSNTADKATAAPPTGHVGAPRAQHRRRSKLQPSGLLWILPAMIVSVGVIYYCIGYNGYVSTLDWNGISPNPEHVGIDNYVEIAGDPVFWGAIQHTVIFYLVTFALQTVLGILFAVLLHSRVRLAVVYKVIIFLPVVLAPAIMAPVFRIIYSGNGQFNWILEHVGLGFIAQPWLAQSSTALYVIIVIQVWQSTGIAFILYFSAMSQIDPEVLEAARIDGAGNIRVLWSIIVPGIRGTVLALAILNAINALKLFDIPYLVTLGGPNYSTEFLGTFIYRETVPLGNIGYGAALSMALLFLALAMAITLSLRGREKAGDNR